MQFYFNPLDLRCKSVIGGITENTTVLITVYTDAESAYIAFSDDNGENRRLMEKTDGGFCARLSFRRGLYFYYFIAGGSAYYKGENYCAVSGSAITGAARWQLTVCAAENANISSQSQEEDKCETEDKEVTKYKAETKDKCKTEYKYDNNRSQSKGRKAKENMRDYLRGGLIYQIFPDRFNKSGDFSVCKGKVKRNDWGGIPTYRDKDKIVRNNEFFGGNLKGIEEKLGYLASLGTTAIYLNPLSESYSSHRYDTGDYMKIDGVLGTDEDFSSLCKAAKQNGIAVIIDGVYNHTGAGSRYFNKYGDYDSVGAYNSEQSPYYGWYTFKDYPDSYDCWWNFSTLPSIRKECADFQNFIAGEHGVLDKYFSLGALGVRLDVADELSNGFLNKIKERAAKNGAAVIGEVWEDATNKIAYGSRRRYFTDGQLDSVMNYPLRDAMIDFGLSGDCKKLAECVREQINNYPISALDCLMNIISTHDSVRAITLLGRRKTITDKDAMAGEKLDLFEYERGKRRLMCISVIQYTLYGVPSLYYGDEEGMEGDLDPYNRKCFDWEKGDKQLIEHYKKLGKIRASGKEYLFGQTTIIKADKGLFIFSRSGCGERSITAINLNLHAVVLTLNAEATEQMSGLKGKKFVLKPCSFAIYK